MYHSPAAGGPESVAARHFFKDIRFAFIVLALIIAAAVSLLFVQIYLRTSRVLLDTVRKEAATYGDTLLKARDWVDRYGGVWVRKDGSVQANPFLGELGIDPETRCGDGERYTLRNACIMAKEISQQGQGGDGPSFRVVSLTPIDPANVPDLFERRALRQFSWGAAEYSEVDRSGAQPVFRYLRPAFIHEACTKCHATESYAVGDLRGAISISIPIGKLEEELAVNRIILSVAALGTIALLVAILYFTGWRLARRLDVAHQRLQNLLDTDELTDTRSRHALFERFEEEFEKARRQKTPLGLIKVDIDHFKQINDTFGHVFGDMALKAIAGRMKTALRPYDVIGRISGEDFVIVSPAADLEQTVRIAERLLAAVRNQPIGSGERSARVTISAGVAVLEPADTCSDAFLKRADIALHQAKADGRDRVAVG